jgi:hypothetical protein
MLICNDITAVDFPFPALYVGPFGVLLYNNLIVHEIHLHCSYHDSVIYNTGKILLQ